MCKQEKGEITNTPQGSGNDTCERSLWMNAGQGEQTRWEKGGAGRCWGGGSHCDGLQQPPNKTHSEWTGSVFVKCPCQQDIGYFCQVCITLEWVSLSAPYSHRCLWRGRPCSSVSPSANQSLSIRQNGLIGLALLRGFFFLFLASVETVWTVINYQQTNMELTNRQ